MKVSVPYRGDMNFYEYKGNENIYEVEFPSPTGEM